VAFGLSEVADTPLDERDCGGRERRDGTMLRGRWKEEWDVAIEDGRAYGIGGGGDVDGGCGVWVGVVCDGDGCCRFD